MGTAGNVVEVSTFDCGVELYVLASLHVGDDPAGAAEVTRRWFERL